VRYRAAVMLAGISGEKIIPDLIFPNLWDAGRVKTPKDRLVLKKIRQYLDQAIL
jgi:hypothetical protein